MSDHFMTVDPGLGGTGYAVWNRETLSPVKTGVLQDNSDEDWLIRSQQISTQFRLLLMNKELDVNKVYIEYPGLHQTAGGMASAARGDIFKLMFLVGSFAQVCWSMDTEFIHLPVNKWKGQMSKEAVASRVARVLNVSPKYYPNHTMDAVGMGLHLKGVFDGSGTKRAKQLPESL